MKIKKYKNSYPEKDYTPKDECGVFAIYNHPNATTITCLGMHALQHRGQEAAGLVSYDGERFHTEKHIGLVADNFSTIKTIQHLPGHIAVGHVRYSTTGLTLARNIQPLFAELSLGGIAICHNGNLTNALTLKNTMTNKGAIFQSTSDTEVILHLISNSHKFGFTERFIDALTAIEGGYALAALTGNTLIGARDPFGIRPLMLGKLQNAWILTSETCALDIVNAKFIREIENGEVVEISQDGIKSVFPLPRQPKRPCVFEYVYFSRPDSIIDGKSVYECRRQMGKQLAKEAHINADVVIPVPDSGVPAAIGYAEQSKIPFDFGIIRNHYVGRTFIEPTQNMRDMGVKLKHNANADIIKNKKIILIDDSIVRGTTSKKIVNMMYEAGAKEVHMRISSPPILYPDYYGIDTPEKNNLLAAQNNINKMNEIIGTTSLKFLSINGLYKAMGYKKGRNNHAPQFTDHCFTGEYPTPLTDVNNAQLKHDPKQLTLLAEVS